MEHLQQKNKREWNFTSSGGSRVHQGHSRYQPLLHSTHSSILHLTLNKRWKFILELFLISLYIIALELIFLMLKSVLISCKHTNLITYAIIKYIIHFLAVFFVCNNAQIWRTLADLTTQCDVQLVLKASLLCTFLALDYIVSINSISEIFCKTIISWFVSMSKLCFNNHWDSVKDIYLICSGFQFSENVGEKRELRA